MIDWQKAEKLPANRKYFNISIVWIFYYRVVLRLLYWLRIPHELVTLASIAAGIVSASFFFRGQVIGGVVALHLKDLFDACDGALARLTGRGHLIGRYLDSLGDFLVLTLVAGAVALHASFLKSPVYLIWGAVAILSIFIQCSFFNFYQLAYLERFGINTLLSRRSEAIRDDLPLNGSAFKKNLLSLLRLAYIIVYGWQDKLVAAGDNHLLKRCPSCSPDDWYGDKGVMILQSPLCFGTHIFVIMMFAIFGRVEYALIFISTVMNIYLVFVLYYRTHRFIRWSTDTDPEEGMVHRNRM